jgi:hypothetical protein
VLILGIGVVCRQPFVVRLEHGPNAVSHFGRILRTRCSLAQARHRERRVHRGPRPFARSHRRPDWLGILVRVARSPWRSGARDVDIVRARAILALA